MGSNDKKTNKVNQANRQATARVPKSLRRRAEELRLAQTQLQELRKKTKEFLATVEAGLNQIKMEAESLGVTLTESEEEATAGGGQEATPPCENGEKSHQQRKILVVDDDPVTVRLITYFLEKEGFIAITAESGESGFEQAIKEKPDLVILDVMMPGMNGFQLFERLQALPAMRSLPVIFLSSLAEEEDVLRGLQAGWDYIIKPFSPAILLTKIKKLITAKNDPLSERR